MNNIKGILVVLSTLILLSGCTLRFIYNHIDWWANWYLDDFATLTAQQQALFDDKLEQLHLWHRKTQLMQYSAQLTRLQTAIKHGLTPADIDEQFKALKGHWYGFLHQVEPMLLQLAQSLDKRQRQQLTDEFVAINQALREENQALTEQVWLKKRIKSQQEQLQEWFGKLNQTQRQQVAQLSGQYQRAFIPWMQYREQWSDEFSSLLNGTLAQHQFKFEFYRLVVNGELLRNRELVKIRAHNRQVFSDILFYMANNLTDKQAKHVNQHLEQIIEDLNELAAQ